MVVCYTPLRIPSTGNDGEEQRWSFSQLLAAVCRFGNALRNKGVKKGDRVTIYVRAPPDTAPHEMHTLSPFS